MTSLEAIKVPGLIWISRLVEMALVLTLAWMASLWLIPAQSPDSVPGSGPMQLQAAAKPDIDRLASSHLFGKQAVQAPAAAQSPAPVVAAPTQLNIRLMGTVVAGDRSSAVMRLGNGKEKVYFVHEEIQAGVMLEEVQVDAVIVDNRGRKEKVLMAKGSLGSAVQSYSPRPEAPVSQHLFTREVIQNQLQDLPKLLTGALAVPHQSNGNPDGFLIQSIVSGSLYEMAGLKNGDIIHGVNGKPVITPEQGIALFQALKEASSIDLDITRAGNAQQLHFEIR